MGTHEIESAMLFLASTEIQQTISSAEFCIKALNLGNYKAIAFINDLFYGFYFIAIAIDKQHI
jgi:hypothetical protein